MSRCVPCFSFAVDPKLSEQKTNTHRQKLQQHIKEQNEEEGEEDDINAEKEKQKTSSFCFYVWFFLRQTTAAEQRRFEVAEQGERGVALARLDVERRRRIDAAQQLSTLMRVVQQPLAAVARHGVKERRRKRALAAQAERRRDQPLLARRDGACV